MLEEVVGLWALRLHSVTQANENRVPEYKPYVVEAFGPEQIQEKILKVPWDSFVRDWAGLNRMFTAIKACDNSITGNTASVLLCAAVGKLLQ